MKGHEQIFCLCCLCECVLIPSHTVSCALQLICNHNTLSLTSVALSAWSLMLIKACNSLSDPRMMGDSQGLFVLEQGSTALLWLGWLFLGLLLKGCGPKRLSSSVSLSLDSLDDCSGCLEAVVVRILERRKKKKRKNNWFKSRTL